MCICRVFVFGITPEGAFCGLQALDFVHFFCNNTKKYKNFMKIIRNDIENVLTKW